MSSKLYEISHVLFDLDGLLLDTESCYSIAFNNLAKKYGKQFTWDLKVKCMGLSPIQSSQTVINDLDLPLTVDQLLSESHNLFEIAVKSVELLPGSEKLVKHLHKHNIPMAIATGSNSQSFATKIAKHNQFFAKSNYFNHYVLAGDDPNVKRGKPFPDVFIEAMNRFDSNLNPQNVLVFEDSPLGVKAALAAGMPCVWVPDPRCDLNQLNATVVLKSLEEFKPEVFGFPPFDS